jgi:hypothetical protein
MQPIYFEGAKEISKPENMTDEQCMSMWALPIDYVFTDVNGNQVQSRYWVEAWKPSKEDIDAINRGEPIYLQIHSIGLPPVAVFTLDENGKSNDAGR